MISQILKEHVYKGDASFKNEISKDKFTLYQYILQLYILAHVNQKRIKYLTVKDDGGSSEKVVDVFKHYNTLLHQIFESENIIVAIPDPTNIPNVVFYEVDRLDDGYAYMANVELGIESPNEVVFKETVSNNNDKIFLNYQRMGKYD